MQSIFVSGAASGIGKAVAQRFLDEGWLVGAYDIIPATYDHKNLVTGTLDVRDADNWDRALAEFAERAGGKIDAVDNNAGIIVQGPLEDEAPEALKRIIDVNVLGVTLGARAAHRYLKGGGTLLSMCSASAIYGQPGITAYSATKFYVKGLTEALNLEWKKDRIRVVDLMPLWAKTDLAANDAASIRRLGVKITPDQVADVVWDAVNPSNLYERGKVHYGVSTEDKVLGALGSIAPTRLGRIVNGFIAG